MDTFVEDVSSFATEFRLEWAGDEAVGAAVARLADSVACGIGGWNSVLDSAARAIAVPAAAGPTGGLLLGENTYLAADMAAFVNTVAIRYLDFNDTMPGGHPSDMLGGLLAVAGSLDVTGAELVEATVVAYETYARISTSVHLLTRAVDQGFGTGLGTVAGVGRLLGLSSTQIGHALGMMAVAGVPLRASRGGELTNWKGAATAVFVRNAVFCCLLAGEDLTGPSAPIHGRHGLAELLARPIEIPPMPGPGGEFLIESTRLKYWPVAYNMQPAIWAARGLQGRIDPKRIRSIELFTDRFARHESGSEPEKWRPRTRETADHSLPYVVAWTLLHGELDSSSFDESVIGREDVAKLMAKVEVHEDPEIEAAWPQLIQARLQVTDTDGHTVMEHVVNPPGHDRNPLSRADITSKFVRLTSPGLGARGAAAAAELWLSVCQAVSVRELMQALRTPACDRPGDGAPVPEGVV